jgi:hypothetical protein
MDRRMDEDRMRAYERALRLDEFSTPLEPRTGRPFVLTTGQGQRAAWKLPPEREETIRREMEAVIRSSPGEDQQP